MLTRILHNSSQLCNFFEDKFDQLTVSDMIFTNVHYLTSRLPADVELYKTTFLVLNTPSSLEAYIALAPSKTSNPQCVTLGGNAHPVCTHLQ